MTDADEATSPTEREALKSIYRLSKEGEGAQTGHIAEQLGLTPGAVTAIVKRFDKIGLVEYKPYHGVVLTAEGRVQAVAAIRRHRIVERFLSDMLGYAWNEADKIAPQFEHQIPQEVEDRLYQALDRPATCPHGFPIPAPEAADVPELPPLYALTPGWIAVVAVPGSTDTEVLEFLTTMGIEPGVEIEILEKHPFGGPMVIRVEGTDRTLSEKVANSVFVQPRRVRAGM